MVIPLVLLLWLAPPVVVEECINSPIDKMIVRIAHICLFPVNKKLLAAADVEDDYYYRTLSSILRGLFAAHAMLAFIWTCSTLLKPLWGA